MRKAFSTVFFLMGLALGVCIIFAWRSHRSIGKKVALLLASLIPPVIGNLIITVSTQYTISLIGSYVYYLGMDLVMYALLMFTFSYCRISWPNRTTKNLVLFMLIADIVQLLMNPFFGHAFTTEEIIVYGEPYFRLVPHLGQTYHRIIDYTIYGCVVLIYIYMSITSPRIYVERYLVILLAMVVGGAWQTFYIFSRTPIDMSMFGFVFFGLLVFYFALYYQPTRLLDRMLASVASQVPEAIYFYDGSGRCIWCNQNGTALTRTESGNYEAADETLHEMFGEFKKTEEWHDEIVLGYGRNARYYLLEKQSTRDDRDKIMGSFLSIHDNTEAQRRLNAERYNATHDSLTDLFNRNHLYLTVRERIDQNPDIPYLIVYVDIKDFKITNDIFGNDFGDYVLKCVANLIRRNTTPNCIFGRMGGDTFGILYPEVEFDEEGLKRQLANFRVSDGHLEQDVLIHLGVYEVTEKDLDISVMFDRAHLAMSTIEDEFQTYIAYYDDKMRDSVLWNQHISNELHEAIRTRQIRPYLQPIVDISGRVVGAEALVRWIHPDHGFLSPAQFIPAFEKNGMIAEIDRYMWRCACELLAKWKEEGRDDIFISVNISPKDFYFIDVAREMGNIVTEFAIDPAKLRIEITETVMMTDVDNRMRILAKLKEDGFIVEMDDFGSGYSSLNLLKDMPVDVLKIDMAFLNKSKEEEKAQRIVHNIINMSDDLGIESLTEGVETDVQYRMLTKMGCKLFQGYFFARPMPTDEFEAYCFGKQEVPQA